MYQNGICRNVKTASSEKKKTRKQHGLRLAKRKGDLPFLLPALPPLFIVPTRLLLRPLPRRAVLTINSLPL